jgi:hypothetical protein
MPLHLLIRVSLRAESKVKLFGDPAGFLHSKQLMIVYSVDGKVESRTFADNEAVRLGDTA